MLQHIKGAFYSMTIWVNGVVGVIVLSLPDIQASFPQLEDYLPAHLYKSAMLILIVANLLLRFKTKNSLAEKFNARTVEEK